MTAAEDWADEPAAPAAAQPSGGEGEAGEGAPPLRFPTLDAWVEQWFVHAMWLGVDGRARIWCPQWWCHTGAIVRLEALWRSWEAARLDPANGMIVWLREADYQLSILLDPQGPLKGCDADRGHDAERNRELPLTPPPQGLFAPDD